MTNDEQERSPIRHWSFVIRHWTVGTPIRFKSSRNSARFFGIERSSRQPIRSTGSAAKFQRGFHHRAFRSRAAPHLRSKIAPGPFGVCLHFLCSHIVASFQPSPHFDLMFRPNRGQVRDEAGAAKHVVHHGQSLVVHNGETIGEAVNSANVAVASVGSGPL